MDAMHRKAIKIISLFVVVAFLLLLPILVADAANDVASVGTSNGTAVQLTATWTEYNNISIATGSGNTSVYLSAVVSTNSSQAKLYGRIKRDGTVIESINLSQSVYPETATFMIPVAETEATHIYTFEAYCTSGKLCTISNRTFSATFIKTGSFAAFVTNATVNPYNMNASNITTGVLPNASIPLSAANLSTTNNTFTGNVSAKNIGGVIYADQYATIQDAINALNTSRTYKQTVKVVGVYTVTTQINLSNFTILDLSDAKLVMGSGANVGAIRNKNWGENDIDHDIDIIGGEIDGSAMTAEIDDGMVSLRGGFNYSVKNMYVHNGWGFGGIYVTGSNHEISGNTISMMRKTTGQYGTGIYITGPGTYNVKSVRNNILNNAGTGIFLEDRTHNNTVSDNYLYNNSNGINSDASGVPPGNVNIILNNNIIPYSTNRCILFGTTNFSKITNNICNGGGAYDNIYISGSYNNTISGNTVTNAGYDGISLSATTSANVVTNNYGDDTQATPTQGYHILDSGTRNIVYLNYLSSRYRIGTLSASSTGIYKDNYGTSPFNFGNKATAPTAFGFGDEYSNSTSFLKILYNGTAWNPFITLNKFIAGNGVTLVQNAIDGTLTINATGYNATYDAKLSNVSAGTNITITWSGCPSACVAQINSTGTGGTTDNASVNPYSMNATNLTSGTIPSMRYGTGIYTANISDYSAGSITNITVNPYSMNGSNISSGTIPSGRYGTGIYTQNISNYPTDFPNVTVAENLANWNATNTTAVRESISASGNATYNSITGVIDALTNTTAVRNALSASGLISYNSATGAFTDTVNASAEIPRSHVTGQEGVDTGQNTTHTNLANYLNNTFPGSSFITTLGTIATGIWQGTKIAGAYLVDADRWNAVLTSHNNTDLTHDAKFDAQNVTNNLKVNKTELNSTTQINVTQVNGLRGEQDAQNTSFQNSSFGVVLTNGSNAIATGYYDAILEIPASGTITSLSVQGRYTGAINLSLMYNATSVPVYPGDVVASINVTSGSSASSTGLSVAVVQNGNLMPYVDANGGAVNKTNLRGILRRS